MSNLISRQDVIDIVHWYYRNMYGEDAEQSICESIENLPSVEPTAVSIYDKGYEDGYNKGLKVVVENYKRRNGKMAGKDLISRQDAIEAIRATGQIASLEALPSAEPKKGKWVKSEYHASGWCCDKCEYMVQDIFNFCPECGADMREDELKNLPSAQMEIVKCHKCIHWNRDTIQQNSNDAGRWDEAICEKYSDEFWETWKDADWYCADAERRPDE